MDLTEVKRKRDRLLRRRLLDALYVVREDFPMGRCDGAAWRRIAETGLAPSECFESDAHAMALMRDVEERGYAEITYVRTVAVGGDVTPRHVRHARLTTKGVELHDGVIDPDPLIEDGRELIE